MRWRRRREVSRDEPPAWLPQELKEAHARGARIFPAPFCELLAAAVADVGANRRGKSIAEVADELGVRLVADGIQLPREVLMWHARNIVEPYWPLLHPIEVIRGVWASRGADDEDSLEEPALFAGEATENPEDALGFLLREHPDVRSVNFSTSAANVVDVFLMPWSEVAAQWVRDVCSPREVRFVDDLPQWRDWNDRWG